MRETKESLTVEKDGKTTIIRRKQSDMETGRGERKVGYSEVTQNYKPSEEPVLRILKRKLNPA